MCSGPANAAAGKSTYWDWVSFGEHRWVKSRERQGPGMTVAAIDRLVHHSTMHHALFVWDRPDVLPSANDNDSTATMSQERQT